MYMDKRFPQLLALLTAVLYLVELNFIFSLTPEGYSVNIYEQIGYMGILLNIFVYGAYLILLSSNRKRNIIIALSLSLILLLNYTILMIAPTLLGYYATDRADTLTTIGNVRYIIKTGYSDPLVIYPVPLIESAILSIVSNTKAPWGFMSVLGSLLFVLGTVSLARIFIKDIIRDHIRQLVPLLLSVSVPYYLGMYHTSFIAQYITFTVEGIFILSFFLYIFRSSSKFLISLLVLAIFSVFGHPVLGVFNIYFLLIYSVFLMVQNPTHSDFVKSILKITIVVLTFWVIEVGLLGKYINTLQVMLEKDFRVYATAIKLSKNAGISIVEALRYAFIRYGDQIILYLISILSAISIIRKRSYITNIKTSTMLIGFTLSNMFVMAILVFPILRQNYNRVLGLNLGLYFAIPLAGLLISETLKKNLVRSIVKLILFTTYVISVMGLFLSPYVGLPFMGITNNELSGVSFMFAHQSQGYKVVDPIGDSKRYSTWYYGYSETFKQNKILYLYRLPDHFNYPKIYPIKHNQYLIKTQHNIFVNSEVPYSYNNLMIPISRSMIERYEVVETFRRVHRWSYRDLMIVSCDPTADIIYRNGKEFNIILIP